MKKLLEYANDPTDDYVEVKELTAEEAYYQTDFNSVPETAQVYVTYLERKSKIQANALETKNRMLREMLQAMKEARPELEFYHKELQSILNVK